MSETVTLKGAAALAALGMIAEARNKFPALNRVSDSDILLILIGAGLTNEEARN